MFKNQHSRRAHCYSKHGRLPKYKYKTKHSGAVSKPKNKKKSVISKTAAKLTLTNENTPKGNNLINQLHVSFYKSYISYLMVTIISFHN